MDGMRIDGQLLTSGAGETVLEDAYLLLFDDEIASIDPLSPLLREIVPTGRPVLIVAAGMDEAAVAKLEVGAERRPARHAIKVHGFGDRRRDVLGDIATLTGGQLLSAAGGEHSVDQLGRAGRIEVGASAATLTDGKGARESLRARVDELRATIHDTTSDYDREACEARLDNLLAGVAGGESSLPESTQRLQSKPSPTETWLSARRLGRNWALLGVGMALVLLGVGLLYAGRGSLAIAEQSESWPTAQGQILSSKVVRTQQRRAVMDQPRRLSTNAEVRYSFTVMLRRYEGDRIRFGGGTGGSEWGSTEEAEAAVARYPVGKVVTVYFDPTNPAQSVLETGSASIDRWPVHALPIGLGSLFLVLFCLGRVVGLLHREELS